MHKYSFVPQTDPPYQFDKSIPDDPYIDFAEPQKVTLFFIVCFFDVKLNKIKPIPIKLTPKCQEYSVH